VPLRFAIVVALSILMSVTGTALLVNDDAMPTALVMPDTLTGGRRRIFRQTVLGAPASARWTRATAGNCCSCIERVHDRTTCCTSAGCSNWTLAAGAGPTIRHDGAPPGDHADLAARASVRRDDAAASYIAGGSELHVPSSIAAGCQLAASVWTIVVKASKRRGAAGGSVVRR